MTKSWDRISVTKERKNIYCTLGCLRTQCSPDASPYKSIVRRKKTSCNRRTNPVGIPNLDLPGVCDAPALSGLRVVGTIKCIVSTSTNMTVGPSPLRYPPTSTVVPWTGTAVFSHLLLEVLLSRHLLEPIRKRLKR